MDNILIIGAKGQLGLALQTQYPAARTVDIDELDISNPESVTGYDWNGIDTILNAAAYTNVDGAETAEGRVIAWQANASAVKNIANVCISRAITLVHISTDYVFDGTKAPHLETEPFSPLSAYGQSKAAGDIAVSLTPKHYILRTSWVIGDGKNFVRTMLEVGKKGINPTVVSDQLGRPTFTAELVRAVDHLLNAKSPYGTYNVSNEGGVVSWAALTRTIYKQSGLENTVTDISTVDYYKNKAGIAPRPLQSNFDLSKLQATGFSSTDWQEDLKQYLTREQA